MGNEDRQGEFHKADPAYRRQMMVVLAIVVVIGALALFGLQLWLAKLGARASAGDVVGYEMWLNRLLGGLCLLLAATAAGFGYWLMRTAGATGLERRWPPSSMRTSSDVRIRYLTSADALVTQLRGGAIVLFVMALLLGGWAAWLFRA